MKKFIYIITLLLFSANISVCAQEISENQHVDLFYPVPSPWSYGMFVGVGGLFPTGDISDAFSGACRFELGLTGGWKRCKLKASVGYSSPTIRNRALVTPEYADQNMLANVKNANLLDAGFGVGFDVLDTRSFSITPFVGGRWSSYSWTSRPMEPNDEGSYTTLGPQHRIAMNNFNFACGIDFEWHFLYSDTSLMDDSNAQYVSSLRLTPFAMKADYNDACTPYSGWQFGFTISYSGLIRALK
ncbi:MAG: hypothetical protein NC402_05230 [Prevotella sp.]|nr:hypothetical protein [Prevotella sp.]MCM1075486.1 hypothetical protein [Ruminococcus sp.]